MSDHIPDEAALERWSKRYSRYTEFLMKEAIERIDAHFREGYAEAHPELISGFMIASVLSSLEESSS